MSYLVIARKWRPKTFEDVVGQSHVTRTLQNAISAGRVAHAYLFTGPRGVGKTSTARILAKALNCEKGPTPHPCLVCPACLEVAGPGSVDVVEIDGASNNSVDDIRSLREKVQYTGARDRYKVYIIDEVHMLSGAAFNALLKTLEEPPAHVVFIFATTEAVKVPPTILSRTQRFDFKRVGAAEVAAQLAKILSAEGLDASQEALQLVARAGEGSVRDSQTLLDQVISFALGAGEKQALRAEDVLAVLGGVQEGQAWGALQSALRGDTAAALMWVQEQYQRGADLRQVLEAFQGLLRGLLLLKSAPGMRVDVDLLPETVAVLSTAAHGLGLSRLFTALKAVSEAEQQLRYSSQTRLVIELLIIKLAPVNPGAGLGEIVDELRELEQKFRNLPADAAFPPALTPPGFGAPLGSAEDPKLVPGAPATSAVVAAPLTALQGSAASAPASVPQNSVGLPPVPAPQNQGAFVSPAKVAAALEPSPGATPLAHPAASQNAVASALPPAHQDHPASVPPAAASPAGPGSAPAAALTPRNQPAPAPLPPPDDPGQPASAIESVEEASPDSGDRLDLDTLRKDWESLVAEVQNESLTLASAAMDAGLMALEGGTLTLKAVNGFQRKVLDEPAERVRLEAALSKRYGRSLKVRVVFVQPAARAAKGSKPGEEEVQRILNERPQVRRVQELFGAEIVEIRED